MDIERLRAVCLGFRGAGESVQWGESRVYKVGGKMFAVASLSGGKFVRLSFKASPDSFHILTQTPGIVPAPYLARALWVAVEDLSLLPEDQLTAYLERSYRQVIAKLPKRFRAALAGAPPPRRQPQHKSCNTRGR